MVHGDIGQVQHFKDEPKYFKIADKNNKKASPLVDPGLMRKYSKTQMFEKNAKILQDDKNRS